MTVCYGVRKKGEEVGLFAALKTWSGVTSRVTCRFYVALDSRHLFQGAVRFPMKLYKVTLLACEREGLVAAARKGSHPSQKKMQCTDCMGEPEKND